MSSPSGLEVEGADAVLQQLPGNQGVHPLQEQIPAGLAFLALVFQSLPSATTGGRQRSAGPSALTPSTGIGWFNLTMPHPTRFVQRVLSHGYHSLDRVPFYGWQGLRVFGERRLLRIAGDLRLTIHSPDALLCHNVCLPKHGNDAAPCIDCQHKMLPKGLPGLAVLQQLVKQYRDYIHNLDIHYRIFWYCAIQLSDEPV